MIDALLQGRILADYRLDRHFPRRLAEQALDSAAEIFGSVLQDYDPAADERR